MAIVLDAADCLTTVGVVTLEDVIDQMLEKTDTEGPIYQQNGD